MSNNKTFYGYLDNDTKVVLDNNIVGIGDEYHTLHDLYQHRMALNIALFNLIDKTTDIHDIQVFKAKEHHPASDSMFPGYFIVWCTNSVTEEWTSYHYTLKHWDKFRIPEAKHGPHYPTGHVDSISLLERLWED